MGSAERGGKVTTTEAAATEVAATAMEELTAELEPGVVATQGPIVEQAGRIWNAAARCRPALVVRARRPGDVQAAVLAARRHGLPLAVRGGGHDWAGRSLREKGLVIDLSGMREVLVDPVTAIAEVGGGALITDVIAASTPHGLVAVAGTVGSVGMAGLTLAGGYGPLNGRFGLALDNLLGAQVVLADGRLVSTDENTEPELFWALRGGGGNFGVVTSLRLRLHPIRTMLAGLVLFPWAEARQILTGLAPLLAAAPDELTIQSGVLTGPDGGPTLFLAPTWSGEEAAGEEAVAAVLRLGTPIMSQIAPMSYAQMLSLFDAHVVSGRNYAARTRNVAEFSPEVISAVVQAGSSRSSPLSGIVIHNCHGATARVDLGSTAFGLRRNHLLVEIVASWEPGGPGGPDGPDGDTEHRDWAEAFSQALAPMALPGGYPNMLGPEATEQIEHAYGPHGPRLNEVKRRYDPQGVFSATSLPRA
jgi:FAD/FMN-containing dehydrogenase